MKKLVLVFLLLLPLLMWAQSPFDGTWKVNLGSAQFSDKPDVFALENGRYTCSTCMVKIDVKADGTDQEVPGAMSYDTLAVKQVSDKAVQLTRKKDGKVVSEATDTVSADGNTLVAEFKEYPAQGQPVTGKVEMTRVSAGPAGSHAISGSWRTQKVENVSEAGLTLTFKSTADGLTMNNPIGESYDAKFDGKDYPVKGDRAGGTVSLKKMNDSSFEETYKVNGKTVYINQITAQGNTLKVTSKNMIRGTTENFTLNTQ